MNMVEAVASDPLATFHFDSDTKDGTYLVINL